MSVRLAVDSMLSDTVDKEQPSIVSTTSNIHNLLSDDLDANNVSISLADDKNVSINVHQKVNIDSLMESVSTHKEHPYVSSVPNNHSLARDLLPIIKPDPEILTEAEYDSYELDDKFLDKLNSKLSLISQLDHNATKGANWTVLNKMDIYNDNKVSLNDAKSKKLLKKLAMDELRMSSSKGKSESSEIDANGSIKAKGKAKKETNKSNGLSEETPDFPENGVLHETTNDDADFEPPKRKGKKPGPKRKNSISKVDGVELKNGKKTKAPEAISKLIGDVKLEIGDDSIPKKKARKTSVKKEDIEDVSMAIDEFEDDADTNTRKTRARGKSKSSMAELEDEQEEDFFEDQDYEKRPSMKLKLTLNKNSGQSYQISNADSSLPKLSVKEQRAISRQYNNTYVAIWKDLSRKDGPKIARLMQQSTSAKLINFKKTAILTARESKRWQIRTNKSQKDLSTKARRAMREMFNFWKRNERVERDLRKRHDKELIDKAKKEEEERESKRQARKLNFLITQTELYSHFIGKKIKTDEIEGNALPIHGKISNYDDIDENDHRGSEKKDFNTIDFDNEDEEMLRNQAAANAASALQQAQSKAKEFNNVKDVNIDDDEMNFQNPTSLGDINIEQPKLLKCTLKEYQIKGLNWLANLYDQGINGILADEMGLGKTVQSISVLAYLAEVHNIWGPFLVVSPASTLHNWQQEITRFVPEFKVLPYWGNAKDRKVLRKFWDRKNVTYTRDSPFHVLVTSYQLVVADAQYFQRIKWQYMILDEAQAIKSSQSSRWKSLLSFQCRNRLLLTGTPIQNSMQELWALLHFIMPSLFDSHDEFSEWFSKDIESHAQSNTQLNEQQLRRLHVILKPFMLRRIKKNVQSELGDKIELDLYCNLTTRQRKFYQMLKSQISVMDLIDKATSGSDDGTQSLMNLVMQFRKVCNHPDLFERADVTSSFAFNRFAMTGSLLRETSLELEYSAQNRINFDLPRLVYDELLQPTFDNNNGSKNKISSMMNIYDPSNVQTSDNFGWLRFIDTSPQEMKKITSSNLIERAIDRREYTDINYTRINRFKYLYDGEEDSSFLPQNKLFLINDYNNKASVVSNSTILKELHTVRDSLAEEMYLNVWDLSVSASAVAPPVEVTCSSNSFVSKMSEVLFNPKIRQGLMPLSLSKQLELINNNVPVSEFPKAEMLPSPISAKTGYSNIRMPSMDRFITESGKLSRLDELLVDLKQNDHRVLIYFQMTKMMDLMEEFLTYRQYKYIRLDGSSKLDDRRDLVNDWQTKPEIFVFLLSTRAGGLGINLTAADTVVFYDSDWNPTIDSQAMDRAHRLGQTRQVTVYRLLVRGTIEERMRDRAKQKEHVQQVVMEGKASTQSQEQSVDFQKPSREVAFWLLDDDAAVDKALKEKQMKEEKKNNKRALKDAKIPIPKKKKVQMEDLYHEGEGNFDDGSVNSSRPDTPMGKKM